MEMKKVKKKQTIMLPLQGTEAISPGAAYVFLCVTS